MTWDRHRASPSIIFTRPLAEPRRTPACSQSTHVPLSAPKKKNKREKAGKRGSARAWGDLAQGSSQTQAPEAESEWVHLGVDCEAVAGWLCLLLLIVDLLILFRPLYLCVLCAFVHPASDESDTPAGAQASSLTIARFCPLTITFRSIDHHRVPVVLSPPYAVFRFRALNTRIFRQRNGRTRIAHLATCRSRLDTALQDHRQACRPTDITITTNSNDNSLPHRIQHPPRSLLARIGPRTRPSARFPVGPVVILWLANGLLGEAHP